MQHSRKYSPREVVLPLENQAEIDNVPYAFSGSPFGGAFPFGTNPSQTDHGVEFQPSEVCPKNFIIFDQTVDRSHIMFHPAVANHFSYPSDFNQIPTMENSNRKFGKSIDRGVPSAFSEVSEDINALLSLDDDDNHYQGEFEEEEVSTARTQAYDGSSSPDSCSNYAPKSRKVRCSSSGHKSSVGGSSCGEGKRKKVRKMVKVLRGMVPGGDQMNTVAVLDEAVKYLKSMKVEAQKLGIGKCDNFP